PCETHYFPEHKLGTKGLRFGTYDHTRSNLLREELQQCCLKTINAESLSIRPRFLGSKVRFHFFEAFDCCSQRFHGLLCKKYTRSPGLILIPVYAVNTFHSASTTESDDGASERLSLHRY